MLLEKDFMRKNRGCYWGKVYVCGCKAKKNPASQLYFGFAEGDRGYTQKLMDLVRAGTLGEQWQQLAQENPTGLVNAELWVFVCDECGYWTNEEELSFYIPHAGGKAERFSSVAFESYRQDADLIAVYPHVCPCCGKPMRALTGFVDKYGRHTIDVENIYQEHLKCPKCKQEILLLCDVSTEDLLYITDPDPSSCYKRYDARYTHKREYKTAEQWREFMVNKRDED